MTEKCAKDVKVWTRKLLDKTFVSHSFNKRSAWRAKLSEVFINDVWAGKPCSTARISSGAGVNGSPSLRLSAAVLRDAAAQLAARDEDLKSIVNVLGPPALWRRPPGFATLVYIIFEQQVSLASAEATYLKVSALMDDFSPTTYLNLSDEALRAAGVSRQKVRYTRLVAQAIEDGSLPIHRFGRYSDARVRTLLTQIVGIGNWTADVYLMSALRRPDLWPTGDLALVKSITVVKGLNERPDHEWLEALGEKYRPFRSVAARIYWDYYLSKGGFPG